MTTATKVPAAPKKQREAPPQLEETAQNLEKIPPLATETLNFKVLAAAGEGAILAGPVGTTPPMVSGGDWTPAGMELVSRENDVH